MVNYSNGVLVMGGIRGDEGRYGNRVKWVMEGSGNVMERL